MANKNTITEKQYFDERADRLGACALDRTGLYNANIRQIQQDSGAFAVKELVQITDIDQDGDDFRLTLKSHTSGTISTGRITMNGILFQQDAPEKGYLVTPPINDFDIEFDEVCKEFLDEIPLYTKQPEPLRHIKHLEAPLP